MIAVNPIPKYLVAKHKIMEGKGGEGYTMKVIAARQRRNLESMEKH